MARLKVVARLVDGSEMDIYASADFLSRLMRLESAGYSGKQLIHELITDDWGPPPNMIVITGIDDAGKRIDKTLPYD